MQDLQKTKYFILGCGRVGSAVVDKLKDRKESLVIVEIDKGKASALKDQGIEVVEGDISDEDVLESLDLNNAEVVMVLSGDHAANEKAVRYIRRKNREVPIIARSDIGQEDPLRRVGADLVLLPSEVVAQQTLHYLERAKGVRKAKALLEKVKAEEGDVLGIVLHFNPEPDSIASALALQAIADSVGTKSKILYFGEIGHQENRAFVNLLDVKMEKANGYNLYTDFKKIALVDHSVAGENNPLPKEMRFDIVIDHHPVDLKNVFADFVDIRPELGATATIMTQYLRDLEIPVSSKLATALFYAIRSDTDDFRRHTHQEDLNAAAFLFPKVDHSILSQLQSPPVSNETLNVIGEAIKNRKVRGTYLVSNVGYITDRDALPQAADYLLNLEGISTTLIFGVGEDQIHISARSKDIRINIGDLLKRAFSDIGSAGGHATAAGARIPLGVFTGVKDKGKLLQLVEDAVLKRFFSAVGGEEKSTP